MSCTSAAPATTCTEDLERASPPRHFGQRYDVEATSATQVDAPTPPRRLVRRETAVLPRAALLEIVIPPGTSGRGEAKPGADTASVLVVPSGVPRGKKREVEIFNVWHVCDEQSSSGSTSPRSPLSPKSPLRRAAETISPESTLDGVSEPTSPLSFWTGPSPPVSPASPPNLAPSPASSVSPRRWAAGQISPMPPLSEASVVCPPAPPNGSELGPAPAANGSPQAARVRASTYNVGILGQAVGSSRFNQPRLRWDWDRQQAGEGDPLVGSVTSHEALWGVILTMGIGLMREKLLVDQDVESYILHFFSFWGVVSAGINYSQIFNDDDAFHKILWSLFTLGMTAQVAYLYHGLPGFALSTGGLYLLIVAAHCRVSYALPRARMFCGFRAFGHLVAVCIFGILAMRQCRADIPDSSLLERALLWAHVFVEPLTLVSFSLCTRSLEAKETWDIPLNHDYMICRYYGLHITVVAVSVMFPLGLAGQAFVSSTTKAIIILCAVLYALLSKLFIVDCTFPVRQHALQNVLDRSRALAVIFLLCVPWSLLGISLTGVGLVAVVEDACPLFARWLIWHGAALSACMLTLGKALHQAQHAPMYRALLAVFALFLCIYFVAPYVEEWNPLPTVVSAVLLMGTLWASQMLLQWVFSGSFPENWFWLRPRLVVDQQQVQDGTFVGANVNSQEYFFSVFFAVCVYRLNEELRLKGDFQEYLQYFLVFYMALWASMRYAARFNDDDAAHKILWSFFAFGLLLMLMGLTAPGHGIFRFATSGVFLLLCVGFFVRAAVRIRKARFFAYFFAGVSATCAALSLMAWVFSNHANTLTWLLVSICVLSDAVFAGLTVIRDDWDVPYNIEYLISRFNGLFMDVLGVAVIGPSAIYPGSLAHANCAAACDALAVMLAVCMKFETFDVEAISFERHALRQSKVKAVAFVNLHVCLILSVGAIGAGTPLLIASAGESGATARNDFAQQLTCVASCIFMAVLALMKILHKPKDPCILAAKVVVQSVGAGLNLLPLVITSFGDFGTLSWIVGVHILVVFAQLQCNAWAPRQPRSPLLLA